KQRLRVANALLGNPKILLLDEPTAGLDPKERVSLRNVFERLGKDHILLIATHVVSDVESIADYILFLKKGRMIEEASPEVLYKKYQEYQLEEIYLSLFQEEVL
ncbi:MAG: ABC transporter ATP-binding protein, partial [Longicatena sp.]